MIVQLLGGNQDGREINMGPGWPGINGLPPYFRVAVVGQAPVSPWVEAQGVPDPTAGMIDFLLFKYNDQVAVYRDPAVKL